MKKIVTGQGDDGRSVVLTVEDVGQIPEPGGQAGWRIWSTDATPPDLGFERPHTIDALDLDLGVSIGGAAFMYSASGPGRQAPMHRTATLDVGMIVAGSVELILENGGIEMSTGDCVVLPAVVHAWRAGPGGCVIAGISFGIHAP